MSWSYTLADLARALNASASPDSATITGVSTDTRTIQSGDAFFALKGERFDANEFVADAFKAGAAAVVVSAPTEAGPSIVVPDTLTALQQFAAYHRNRFSIPVIGITGSCGKTSSKDLIAAVLGSKMRVVKTTGNLNNEIGCPLSLLQIDDRTEAAVIEMGAAAVGNIAELCAIAKPTESAITMVAPAHLLGFGSIENISKAKAEIAEGLPREGVFYVNANDPWCVWAADRFPGRKIMYGSQGDVILRECEVAPDGEIQLDVSPIGKLKLPLPSRAHAANALLAIAVGLEHGIAEFEEPLRAALSDRIRFNVRRVGALDVIDDTYNASPVSMAAAVDALCERPGNGARLAALGDMLELGPQSEEFHRELGAYAASKGVARVYAIGGQASAIIRGARDAGLSHADVFEDPLAMATAIHAQSNPGDVLLVKGSRGMRMERVIEALERLTG